MSEPQEETHTRKLLSGSTPVRTASVLVALLLVTLIWLIGLYLIAKHVLHWIA